MAAWGDPWVEASDDRHKGAQLAQERHVLENWQDDAGWREWQDQEGVSRSRQIEKREDSQPASIQIPARKHTVLDNLDSAVSFGTFRDDIPKSDFVNGLPMDADPDSAILPPAASSGAELSSPIASRMPVKDAKDIQLLQGQYAIPDASSNAADIVRHRMSPNVSESSMPDFDLVKQLFSVPKSTNPIVSTEPNAIISSISSRKVWYRITRKETLREFNMGDSDGEYVRVNWIESNIRKMTLGIVSRFAMGDQFNSSVVVGMSRWCGSSSDSCKDLSRSKIAGRNNMLEPTGEDAKISHVPCKGERMVGSSNPVPQFSWSTLPIAASKFEDRIQTSRSVTSIDEVSVIQPSKNTGVSAQQGFPREVEETPASKYMPEVEDGNGDDDRDGRDDEWGEMVGSGYVNEKKFFTNADDAVTPADSWTRNVEEFVNSLPDISYIFK